MLFVFNLSSVQVQSQEITSSAQDCEINLCSIFCPSASLCALSVAYDLLVSRPATLGRGLGGPTLVEPHLLKTQTGKSFHFFTSLALCLGFRVSSQPAASQPTTSRQPASQPTSNHFSPASQQMMQICYSPLLAMLIWGREVKHALKSHDANLLLAITRHYSP